VSNVNLNLPGQSNDVMATEPVSCASNEASEGLNAEIVTIN